MKIYKISCWKCVRILQVAKIQSPGQDQENQSQENPSPKKLPQKTSSKEEMSVLPPSQKSLSVLLFKNLRLLFVSNLAAAPFKNPLLKNPAQPPAWLVWQSSAPKTKPKLENLWRNWRRKLNKNRNLWKNMRKWKAKSRNMRKVRVNLIKKEKVWVKNLANLYKCSKNWKNLIWV